MAKKKSDNELPRPTSCDVVSSGFTFGKFDFVRFIHGPKCPVVFANKNK